MMRMQTGMVYRVHLVMRMMRAVISAVSRVSSVQLHRRGSTVRSRRRLMMMLMIAVLQLGLRMAQVMSAATAREEVRASRRYIIVLAIFLAGGKLRIDHDGRGGQMMIPSLLLMLMMVSVVSTGGGRIHQEGTHVRGALSRGKHTHAR